MKGIVKLSVLALMAMGYQAANADPVNINITGNVVASPCTVNNNNNNLNIDLGTDIQAKDLFTAGSGSALTPFNLSLTSCPLGTSNVKVTFTGTADTTSPVRYKNTGTATNLAVELSQQGTGTLLNNNSSLTQPVLGDNTVTYALNARAYATSGSVTPGSISSVVQVNFTYN
ncbi:type 1 fimbrial protein [Rahnella sp. PD12R]|uniref:fimbrial protein n=1 Tax=Rahnella sp. PD12R TaxID=2855688 RepID=UPI001C4761FB|nr:fimbrial protein [Rahnella sp. PD12R]MBV6817990.1 type 1 fimbrial protein [Rahnella sp. PD12R]